MSNVMFGYINYFQTGTINVSASPATSFVDGLSPANLSSDQVDPSLGWQTEDGVKTAAAGAYLEVDLGTASLVRLMGIGKCNLTTSGTVTFELHHSGSLVYTATVGGPSIGYAQVIDISPANVTADKIIIKINDSTNPDNHISVGWAFAGPVWNPEDELGLATQDSSYRPTPTRQETKTRGGQRYIQPFYVERVFTVALNAVKDDEAWTGLGDMLRIANLGSNILFIPDATSTEINREAVYGVLDTTQDIGWRNNMPGYRAWIGQITERQ